MRTGNGFLAFPGPGGYKIEWSPGTRLLPMTTSPSGHLVVPCDHFNRLADGASKGADSTVYVTDFFKQ